MEKNLNDNALIGLIRIASYEQQNESKTIFCIFFKQHDQLK